MSIFLNYKTNNSKIYPMWAMSINNPKFPEISFFETFYIQIRHLVFVTLIHLVLCTLIPMCL